ncbi:hypothetical protein F2Q70_00004214 [Brassica cretica]|uniref:Uncharacterized protein n=1 Tax=Brassica cretica TaxID=69181 RepID=A0A8S9INC7_BRACR|nr:hypothetical protein F2Q70_00004214 [Brassica cretica]
MSLFLPKSFPLMFVPVAERNKRAQETGKLAKELERSSRLSSEATIFFNLSSSRPTRAIANASIQGLVTFPVEDRQSRDEKEEAFPRRDLVSNLEHVRESPQSAPTIDKVITGSVSFDPDRASSRIDLRPPLFPLPELYLDGTTTAGETALADLSFRHTLGCRRDSDGTPTISVLIGDSSWTEFDGHRSRIFPNFTCFLDSSL